MSADTGMPSGGCRLLARPAGLTIVELSRAADARHTPPMLEIATESVGAACAQLRELQQPACHAARLAGAGEYLEECVATELV